MTAKISRSAWCLRQSGLNPDHYPDITDLARVPSPRNTRDTMTFSAYVGTEDRGYDVRVSLDFEDVQAFYRDRAAFSEQRLADEIAHLSALLAKRIADKKAQEKETAA
jgi:hypothetical protein